MYEDKPAPVLMRALAKASRKSYKEIAKETGLAPNMISMIMTGAAPLPVARAKSLAASLGIEPKLLIRECITTYSDRRGWQAVAMTI